MFGIATDNRLREIIKSADKYLYDKKVGGYRLNARNLETKTLQLGRVQGLPMVIRRMVPCSAI